MPHPASRPTAGRERAARGRRAPILPLCVLATLAHLPAQDRAEPAVSFSRDVQPLLADRCFPCHGPDAGARKAGLRLDVPESALGPLKKGKGKALVAGSPEQSVAWLRMSSDDAGYRMPPLRSKLHVSAGELATLKRWIEQGATYEPHWAFVPPPAEVPVPRVRDAAWPRNDIDRFVLARLEREGLRPAPEADRPRWLRRVTYDLTGLPPAPEELAAFLADEAPGAHERVVARLLASERYGERMAVPWLDAARYADSYGYQSDQLSPTWPFRDWVVRAFNAGMPYDRFLVLQLAGDLVPGADRETRCATAFNRLHRQTNEGGSIDEELRTEYAADRVNTFGSAALGLTLECARCHDHKFDPITQRDYYQLFAFFDSIDEHGTYNDAAHVPTPSLLLPDAAQAEAMRRTAAEREQKLARVRGLRQERLEAFRAWLREPRQAPDAPDVPGLLGHYELDSIGAQKKELENRADPKKPGKTAAANELVAGHAGQALRFTGDDAASFPGVLGALPPWQPFTVSFRLSLPAGLADAVVFHRTSGTDTGFHGTELTLDGGRLALSIQRFWPGNAVAVRTRARLETGRFVHVAVSHDGSAAAAGMRIWVDGEAAELDVLRDRLEKSPGNGGDGLDFGERFRSFGLKGAALDDVRIHGRALAAVEVRQLRDGESLAKALAARDEDALLDYWLVAIDPVAAAARAELAAAVQAYFAARDPVAETMVMEEQTSPRPTFVLERGRYDAAKTAERRVTRGTPAALPPFPADAPRTRLGLARWLVDPAHPLTARVAVNRLWQLCFGRGLVEPSDNLGKQGSSPTHPELLDWLARDFVRSGWDTKALVAQIVLSATYRQSSAADARLRARDPDDALLARGPAQRLYAEMVRDTALAASGLLSTQMYGPPVSPYQPGDLWREANSMSPPYRQSVGEALYRRSLYTVWKRTAPMPNMVAFDAPSREVCTLQRQATATPQQALVLLDDPQFVEAARVLAERVLKTPGLDDDARVRAMFVRLAAREPDAVELRLLSRLRDAQRLAWAAEPERAAKLVAVGAQKADPGVAAPELAAWTIVAQAILNLDAVVWKR